MSCSVGTYSFLPCLRNGLANKIAAPDGTRRSASAPASRSTLELGASALDGGHAHTSRLPQRRPIRARRRGRHRPARHLCKTEPRNWITNFEPNYLPYIEFYEEDFPVALHAGARRTGAASAAAVARARRAGGGRVRRTRPSRTAAPVRSRSRPPACSAGRPALGLGARARQHGPDRPDGVLVSTTWPRVLPRLDDSARRNPDLAYSRLMCPRKLSRTTRITPSSCRSSRAAGWPGSASTRRTPPTSRRCLRGPIHGPPRAGTCILYYHRWYFRDGHGGDFEYLVRLLKARPPTRA